MPQPRLWLDEIRDVLADLGGQASLQAIYGRIEERNIMNFAANPNWKAAVRRTIEQHSSDSDTFTGLSQDDIFYPAAGKGAGIWALRHTTGVLGVDTPAIVTLDDVTPHYEPQQTATTQPISPTITDGVSTPPRVFVSHSHKDNEFTAQLVGDLRSAGADVWVDMTEIGYDDFVKQINAGLTNRDWMIFVMTPDALKSPWVELEVNTGIALAVRLKMRAVIPVIAKPCNEDDIPPLWATYHTYDATKNYSTAMAQLLKVLELTK